RVYIEEGSDIGSELYLSMVIDRATSRVSFIASKEGGVDIEEVAAHHPERIITVAIDPAAGIQPHHARSLAFGMELPLELHADFGKLVT
ncbi:ATP-grasp domain-containing protein, partial [Staphylococcus aureus]